ncbi:transmembrane protein 198-B [Clupea harengus]|uniref:Transmembrane protein 198 n=1 Tax=Clupea harengus TaxID=7950 RepID=A0A6P8GQV2_CLUHA|nr:transmembrane protein 198-B [Clupea harengus]
MATDDGYFLAHKLALPPWDAGSERLLRCEDEIERRYEIVPSVVCSMCCLFGIIYCFFGYRCFKAVMFLTGLMFGSVVIFMLCYKERVLDTQLSVEASVGIGLGIGTLCGLVTMLVRSVGLFMVGLLLGLLVALASLVVLEEFYEPRTMWLPLGVLLGSGMLFAVLTLQWQRCFVTLSTATFGAAVITVTVDYFVEMLALVRHVYERVKLAPRHVCWFTWVIMGVWPTLALLGVLIQWKVTAEGYSHTEVFISHQQRRVQLMKIRQREERKECNKKKKKKKQPQPKQQQQHHHQQKPSSQQNHHDQHPHPRPHPHPQQQHHGQQQPYPKQKRTQHQHHSQSQSQSQSSSHSRQNQYQHPQLPPQHQQQQHQQQPQQQHPQLPQHPQQQQQQQNQYQSYHSHSQPHTSRSQKSGPHPDPTYRRKPNPIRRFDGDVLSPSYIQSFRDRQGDSRGYSQGRMVGGSHHIVDLDYDYGSQVPLTAAAAAAAASEGPNVRV